MQHKDSSIDNTCKGYAVKIIKHEGYSICTLCCPIQDFLDVLTKITADACARICDIFDVTYDTNTQLFTARVVISRVTYDANTRLFTTKVVVSNEDRASFIDQDLKVVAIEVEDQDAANYAAMTRIMESAGYEDQEDIHLNDTEHWPVKLRHWSVFLKHDSQMSIADKIAAADKAIAERMHTPLVYRELLAPDKPENEKSSLLSKVTQFAKYTIATLIAITIVIGIICMKQHLMHCKDKWLDTRQRYAELIQIQDQKDQTMKGNCDEHARH